MRTFRYSALFILIAFIFAFPCEGSPPKVSGGAYFFPENIIYRASFSMEVTGPPSSENWFKYYYTKTRMNFVSTSITSAVFSVNPNRVVFSGTGTVNGVGGYTFTAEATDSKPDEFKITIRNSDGSVYYSAGIKTIAGGDLVFQIPTNQPPLANAGQNQTLQLSPGKTSINVQLDGSGSNDPDGAIVSYIWTGNPDPDDLVNPTVTLSTGSYTFTLVVTDNQGASSSPSSVTITVLPPSNQAPMVDAGTNQIITYPSSAALKGKVTDDGLPTGSALAIAWSKVSGPGNVTFSNPNSAVSDAYFSQGGTYVLRLTANDSQLSNSSEVTILVNQPPVANAGPYQHITLGAGQTSVEVQLDGSGSSDPDGTIARFEWSGTPIPSPIARPKVSLTTGIHTFTLVVIDNLGASSGPSTVNIQVVKPASPPQVVVTPLEYNMDQEKTLVINLSGISPDGRIVSLSAEPAIKNANFSATVGNPANGVFTFSPQPGQHGIHVVSFKARDTLGLTDRKTIQINVNKVNHPPVLSAPATASVDEGKTLTIPVTATDPDGDVVTLTASGLPNNAIFIPSTGAITFNPDYNQAGQYTFTVTASDGQISVSRNIEVTVNDVTTELVLQVDPVDSPSFLGTQKITGTINPGGTPSSVPKTKSVLITGMNPTSGEQGQTLMVTLSGPTTGDYATHFTRGVSQVSFGPGITINSITVINPSQINVGITIAPTASEGVRSVSVTTGAEIAVSVLAFNVIKGKSRITGKLIDPDTGQPISGAFLTIQGTNIKTQSDPQGNFTLLDVPAGQQNLLINAQNYELLNLPIDARIGTTVDIGTVQSKATVFDPNAPPSVSLISVAGRNFGNATGGLDIEDIKKVITDGILLVGGSEAGVIDEYGNQLNPQVAGSGLISLTQEGIKLIAQKVQRGGETVSLGELLFAFSFGFEWTQGSPLSLEEWLTLLQGLVNQAWSESNKPENYLPILMFNRGRNISPNPPELSPFTRLNPSQAFLFSSSLLGYIMSNPQGSQGENRIILAALFNANIISDISPPFLLYAQASPPEPPPQTSPKPFTAFWRNAFQARNNVLTSNFNNAFASYLMTISSFGIPFINRPFTTGISIPGSGSIVDQMTAAIINYKLDNIVPEAPQANTIGAEVTTDETGAPMVKVNFRLSPTQTNDPNPDRIYVYTLYRYGAGNSDRKLVAFKASTLAQTNGFDMSLRDAEPLPLVTDPSGQIVRAPSATWFYTLTVSMLKSGAQIIDEKLLDRAAPWWSLPLHKLSVPGQTLISTPQVLMSDYSVPIVVNVTGSGEINVEEIEVDPQTGDVYLSDRFGGGAEKQPRFVKISEEEGSKTFALSGFKNPPGHKGLAIDKEGNLYTDNAASDGLFGGRIFKFYQPDGRREFVGNINYFSQMLMYARPTSAGPMAIGPGTMPQVSEEDLYVVDELEGMVKRVMVNATFDPFRRVGQPFANIPLAGPNVDLEVDETGNVYLLKERIPATVLNLSMNVSKTSLELNETFTVTLTVTNPGSETATGVHILPMVIEGLGSVRLVKLPANPTVDLAPGETATFTFEYLAATTGTVKFAAQVDGTDTGGYTISSPVVRSDAAIEIIQPKPLQVFIEYPEKSKPVIGLQEVLKVELTVQASAFNEGIIEEIRFQGEPLALTPGGKLEVVSRDPQEIPTEFSLKPGESKTFKFDLRGVKWGTTQLSSFVAAVDSKGQTLSASDSIKVTVKANLLKVNLKAEPSGLKLEKDAENKPIPQEVNVTVDVKNIINEPLPVVNIPGRLLLYAVYETSTVQMNCPLTQISPDPIGSDWITSLQPGETKTRSYVFKAEDDGKCDVEATVTAADPENPDNPFLAGSAERVVVSKDMLSLDIEFEKDMYFLNKGEIGFGGEAKKKNLGEPFLVFGWVRNLSKFQKLYIAEIKGEILPGSTLARIAKPVLIDNKEREADFDGCGCKPKTILDPGEVLMFSNRVMTVDEPLVREKGITHVDLRFQVIGQAIDPDETRTPVVSNIVERRMPIDYAEKYLTFKEGWYRFTDKALETFCMNYAFPAQLWEMLWVKDKDGNNVLSKSVYDAFAFGIEWWRDLPYGDREALVKKFKELGGATIEETIGKVDKYAEDLGDAVGRGDWGKIAELTAPLAGEILTEAPEFILSCGASWAIKKAGKELVEEGVEAAAKRLIKEKKYSILDMVNRPPGKLKGVKPGYVLKEEVVTWMFGIGEDTSTKLRELAKKLKVNISARYRHPRSAELIKNGHAIPKPEQIKLKTVNDIDQKYLGYPNDPLDDDLATVVFKNKFDLELPGYSQKELGDILSLGGDKALAKIHKLENPNPGKFSKEEWSEILDRYATRVKEHDKYSQELNVWDTQGRTVLKFRFRENALDVDPVLENVGFKLKPVPEGCGPAPALPCKGKRVMIQKPGQDFKRVTGDIDYIDVREANGTPLGYKVGENGVPYIDPARREEVWRALNLMDDNAQHMDSATFSISKVKKEYINDHSISNPDAEPLIQFGADGQARTVYIQDHMTYESEGTQSRMILAGGYVEKSLEGW